MRIAINPSEGSRHQGNLTLAGIASELLHILRPQRGCVERKSFSFAWIIFSLTSTSPFIWILKSHLSSILNFNCPTLHIATLPRSSAISTWQYNVRVCLPIITLQRQDVHSPDWLCRCPLQESLVDQLCLRLLTQVFLHVNFLSSKRGAMLFNCAYGIIYIRHKSRLAGR